METTQAKRSVYQKVTDRIIKLLEQGVVPWKQPWTDSGLPQNLITSHSYRGLNVLLLNSLGYERNLFITAKQLKELSARYKKGEKPHMVIFWKWPKPEEQKDIDIPLPGPILKYYEVFNVDQCEGIPEKLIQPVLKEAYPIPACEKVIDEMQNKPSIKHKDKIAYYNPLADEVNVPKITAFESEESYYATVFHELIHSTGHWKRLNRKGLLEMAEYGADQYSFEELVAELGAAFLESHTGIAPKQIEQNASYISGWLQRLEGDFRLIVQASALAQKATDYILNLEREDYSEEKETEEVAS